jgi:hypothetical protein
MNATAETTLHLVDALAAPGSVRNAICIRQTPEIKGMVSFHEPLG